MFFVTDVTIPPQVKSHTSVPGKAAHGASPVRTSWRGTSASTPASNPSAALTATEAFPAPTTWRFTDGVTSWCETRSRPPSPALTSTPASQEERTPIRGSRALLMPAPCLQTPQGVARSYRSPLLVRSWPQFSAMLPEATNPPVHCWPPPPS